MAELACLAVHPLRRQLAISGITDSRTAIRHNLARWGQVTTRVLAVDRRVIEHCQDKRPRPEATAMARGVGVEP